MANALVWILEIIEASQEIVSETRSYGVAASMKSGLLGCSRTCARGSSIVVVDSGLREEWDGYETTK
jgi:hypothetical protein